MYNANDILKSKTFKMKTKNCKNMMQFAECVVPHLNCICIWSIGNTVTWECRYNINGIFTIFPMPRKPLLSSAVSTSGGLRVLDCFKAGWRGPNTGHIWSPLKQLQSRSSLQVRVQMVTTLLQSAPDPHCDLWHAPWWDHCSGRPPAEPTASSGRNRSV